ncbi:hypothetical protein OR16_08537 [Cupriavidus basilensis OR16]|uniref:Uncharacterized protein n=1 Tax=Cupriavidus basilensis OR16 TaxID=1127483 RepID=H1S205_9BURK|nr:hypothetical protein OR16_08537 [Cupriavidus basilensis OR16]
MPDRSGLEDDGARRAHRILLHSISCDPLLREVVRRPGKLVQRSIVFITTRRRLPSDARFVLEFDDGDGTAVKRVEVMRLHRASRSQASGDVGLSLAEGRSLVNCIRQEFVVERLERFCKSRRACVACGVLRPLHDSHCSELRTTLGKVFYCRERWKACKCGADACRYVSPLKSYLTDASTGERRWLHAELGATTLYRQAKQVMGLLFRSPAATVT